MIRHHRAVLFFLISAFIACSADEKQPPAASTSSTPVLLLLLKTSDNPFFESIQNGVQEAAATGLKGVQVVVRSGANEGDVLSQKRILQEYFDRFVANRSVPALKGVLLTPSGSQDELTSEIARFNASHVPVVLLDTNIDSTALLRAGARYDTYIGSDNRQGGNLAASLIRKALPRGGRILLLNGVQGHETAAQRREGFLAAVKSPPDSGGRFVIEERVANWRRSEARSTMDAVLSMGRSVDAVFAANDEMALGVVEALRQHRSAIQPKIVVGFDAIDEAVKSVKSGKLTATIAQQPKEMGRSAVSSIVSLQTHQAVPKNQVVPVTVVER